MKQHVYSFSDIADKLEAISLYDEGERRIIGHAVAALRAADEQQALKQNVISLIGDWRNDTAYIKHNKHASAFVGRNECADDLELALTDPPQKEQGFFAVILHRADAEAVQRALYLMREGPAWRYGAQAVNGWVGIESCFARIIHAAQRAFESVAQEQPKEGHHES